MARCSFYREAADRHASRERTGDRMPNVVTNRLPWCAHPKHPAVSKVQAAAVGGGKLACGGALDQCALSGEQFYDT